MSNFTVGGEVRNIGQHCDLTPGKCYTVVSISPCGKFVRLISNSGRLDGYHVTNFEAVAVAHPVAVRNDGAMGAGNRHARRMANKFGQSQAQSDSAMQDVLDELDDYEANNNKASVTSVGQFNKGDVLVYLDGTPTLTTLTVKRCSATCVWFDETYSAAFNPTEFRREDDY